MSVETDLKRFLFKVELSAEEAAELNTVADYEEYAAGATILAQDTVNDRLFFLVEGAVDVVRSGETIATLSTPGDILGEMSLITQKLCSASNIAKVPTSLLVLKKERVAQLSPKLQGLYSVAINQLFSMILAEKLTATNEKARMFEITNRELQSAKKALEAASAVRIDDLTANQRVLFNRLHTIRDDLAEVAKNDPSGNLQPILAALDPLAKTLDTENSLHDQRVILVEDDLNEQIHAKMSLGGTGVDFTVVGDLEDAKAAIDLGRLDILAINGKFTELIAYAKGRHPATQFVFITSESVSEHFQTLKQHPELTTILARHPQDRTFTVKNIATTIRKLSSGDIFGMEKYLSWGTEITERIVKRSDQRGEIIAELEVYLDSIGVRGGLKRKSNRVAEELLMNAIYDAPHDAQGKPLYNHLDRAVPLVLKPEEYAKFRYACDGTFLAISVVDRFGALNRQIILNYLERCFTQSVDGESIEGKGGGGNGLFQIIQSSSLTAFNVRPGVQTEVIALFNINIQMEKMSTHPSFHYFEAK